MIGSPFPIANAIVTGNPSYQVEGINRNAARRSSLMNRSMGCRPMTVSDGELPSWNERARQAARRPSGGAGSRIPPGLQHQVDAFFPAEIARRRVHNRARGRHIEGRQILGLGNETRFYVDLLVEQAGFDEFRFHEVARSNTASAFLAPGIAAEMGPQHALDDKRAQQGILINTCGQRPSGVRAVNAFLAWHRVARELPGRALADDSCEASARRANRRPRRRRRPPD